jgi:hypothetical protein
LEVVRDRGGERLEIAAGALELDRALADQALELGAGGDELRVGSLEVRRALDQRCEQVLNRLPARAGSKPTPLSRTK